MLVVIAMFTAVAKGDGGGDGSSLGDAADDAEIADADGTDEADMTLSANRADLDADDPALLAGALLGTDGELAADDPLALDLEDAGFIADAGSSASAISQAHSALQPELSLDDLAGSADSSELVDATLRNQRPSRWGRLDVALTWRRSFNDDAAAPSHRDSLWLLAIWRP